MRLFLVRHGQAVDPAVASSDEVRWLTEAGRKKTKRVGKKLAELELQFSRVVTSPLVRAVQTTEILIHETGNKHGVIEANDALATSGASPKRMSQVLDECTSEDEVALVGHEPSIRLFAAFLLGSKSLPMFRTSNVWALQREADRWSLEWILDPKSLEFVRTVEDYASLVAAEGT